MRRAEAIIGKASRRDAHRLDDQKQRHEIRREGRLWQTEDQLLNEFEKLVKDGQIELFKLPRSVPDAQAGQEIYLERGNNAYDAYTRGIQEKVFGVDTDHPKKPSEDAYNVIHQGPVNEIMYRHPESNIRQVATSTLIDFIILERLRGRYMYKVAFYDPRS